MRKFVFSLEVLQNTKLIQEKEIRKELADIEVRLMEQILVLECIENDMNGMCRTWQTQMLAGMSAMSLQQFNNSFSQLREQQKAMQAQIRKTDQEKTACLDRLVILMTDLKSLEKLKEQQLEQYKQDLAREMENEIGEFVTNHYKPAISIGG